MRLLVLLAALAMPGVAWLSQRGAFGPTNGEVSDRYPTLLVAAGYAFSIWGVIFLLDVAYGVAQATGRRREDPALGRAAPWALVGFAATAAWMPLFSAGQFALCIGVIALATLGVVRAALLARDARATPVARVALGLHGGWLTLASLLNLAQALVAWRVLAPDRMAGPSLVLLAVTTVLLLAVNTRLRSLPYAAAAAWGLVATYVKQSGWTLPGASTAAMAALAAAVLVGTHAVAMALRRR